LVQQPGEWKRVIGILAGMMSNARYNLHLIVNQARFLILPWISVKNLASKSLAIISHRLGEDWKAKYNYEPVLLETFVEKKRYTEACYKAANWCFVGTTKGRGKNDRRGEKKLPIKDIYMYPLKTDFRNILHSG
jgi:hypothetical protein